MRLSQQLGIIVGTAITGLVLMSVFALRNLHSTMLEDRKLELQQILTLSVKQASFYVNLEKQGKLTHDEAKAKVIELLSNIRDNATNTYLWARDDAGLLRVHVKTEQLGTLDESRLPDGTKSYDRFIEILQTKQFGFVQNNISKPGTNQIVPKINGITKLPEWNWIFGFGIYLDDLDAAFWNLATTLIIFGLIILAIVSILAVMLARNIYKSLGGEPAYAAQATLAIANGDLAHKIEGDFHQDSLLGSIKRMQESLSRMISAIQLGADRLTESATDLNFQMHQINSASQNSADATHATAAAIQELSVCIDNISQSAKNSELNSEKSSKLAQQGETLVSKASSRIHEVSAQVVKSSQSIEELQRRSAQIGGIVDVIKEIAEQTNLLALNAAIEAARAGEQGRGFAVVADEVRTLASRTAKATSEITDMINAVRSDTGSVVLVMQEVLPKVNVSVDMSNDAAATLQQINTEASATLDMIREVSHAATEQNTATESVAENVDKIAEMVKETANAVQSAKNSVNDLERLSTQLHDSVGYFKL